MANLSLTYSTLTGPGMAPALSALAQLRIEVFRDFPYLYDGTLAYEQTYLKAFSQIEHAVIVLAMDADEIVGCSTASAMDQSHHDFAAPLQRAGYDVSGIFYFGESVLLAPYRGHGAGHVFFDEREAAARKFGYTKTCFCAVERPLDHPARPADYRPLDPFWQARGYRKLPSIECRFEWTDIGETSASAHTMSYWLRDLST